VGFVVGFAEISFILPSACTSVANLKWGAYSAIAELSMMLKFPSFIAGDRPDVKPDFSR